MKRLTVEFAMMAMLVPGLFSGVAGAAGVGIFTTSLNAAAEIPRVNSVGTGDAQVVVNAAGTSISYTVTYVNPSGPVVAAHIHVGAIDANGPVMLPLTVGPSPLHGTLTAANFQASPQAGSFAAAVRAIRSGNAYINLHTADHPGGELRGQLWESLSLESFGGTLKGSDEVPGVATSGTGTVQLLIDRQGSVISYVVNYSGLSGAAVAAHIHFGAPGSNGPVMLPLAIAEGSLVGTLTSANFQSTAQAPTWADAIAAIRSGQAYVNIHTAAHPGGEVRGNLSSN